MKNMIEVDVSKGIKVGGFTYTVDASKEAYKHLNCANDYGHCDSRNKIIRINKMDTEIEKSETFIHEMMEAIKKIYLTEDLDHWTLSHISVGIHQVMEGLGVRFVVKDGGRNT